METLTQDKKRKTARRHHYVTAGYLAGFLDQPATRLFVVDHELGRHFQSSPDEVAHKRDFNRIDVEGEEPDALENALAAFEHKAIEAARRVCQCQSLEDEEDRAHILNLMALFAVRNPGRRETIREFRENIAYKMMDLQMATPERWASQVAKARAAGFIPDDLPDVPYEELKAATKKRAFRVEVSTTSHLRTEMETHHKMLPYFFNRQWSLLIADDDNAPGFITSDNPVALVSTIERPNTAFWPIGYGMDNTAIIFPLSRNICLVGKFDGDEDITKITDLGVAVVNACTVAHSRRQIYAPNDRFIYSKGDDNSVYTFEEIIRSGEAPN